MPATTTPTVVFFGHGPVADQVRRNLTDLATLGLVDPFFWIDPRLPLHAVSVRHIAEAQEILTLDAALGRIDGPTLLVALDAVDDSTDGLDFTAVERWTGSIDGRLFSDRARVRVLLPRLPRGTHAPAPNPSWTSTVAMAPEDSRDPASTLYEVERKNDPTGIARTAAPALCGLTGLWSSATQCPLLDDTGRPIATGDIHQVRLARSYHRIVDASAVEDRLRRAATDVWEQLPQPVTGDGTQIRYVGEDSPLPRQMADNLVGKYRPDLEHQMDPPVVRQNSRVVWYKALAGFLRKYFREGLGSPRSWAQALGDAANRSAAASVQRSLYGDDSPVRVIADPVEDTGRQLTLDQLDRETDRFRKDVSGGLQAGTRSQLPDMWTGYRNAALTLVDGAMREGDGLEALKDEYNNRYIVRQGWQSVPDVDSVFRGYHPLLGQRLGISERDATVEPFDVRKATAYEQDLNRVAGQTQDPGIRRLQQDFAEWKQDASRSYAWRTSENLAALIGNARQAVTDQVRAIDAAQKKVDELGDSDMEEARRRYRRKTWWFLGAEVLLALVMVLAVVLHYKEEWQLSWFAGFRPGWAALWFVLGSLVLMCFHMGAFADARRGTEKRQQDRNLAEQNLAVADRNLRTAMGNLERQTGAYRQLLSWSTLLGRAISRPFGRDLSTGTALQIPQAGLPLATGIGQSAIDPEASVPLVTRARRDLFRPGWADQAVTSLIDDTNASIERNNGTRPAEQHQLAGQTGAGTGSDLDRLSAWSVSPAMDDRDRTREHWEKVIADPETIRDLSRMVDQVEYSVNGKTRRTTKQEFLAIMTRGDATTGSFLADALDPVASRDRATDMDDKSGVCRLDRSDGADAIAGTLTRSATLTQFGRVTALDNLAQRTDSGAADPHYTEEPYEAPGTADPAVTATGPSPFGGSPFTGAPADASGPVFDGGDTLI